MCDWARDVLVLADDRICVDAAGAVCFLKPELRSPLVRELLVNYVTLERDRGRYLNLDWGGGFIDARGLWIGAPDWIPKMKHDSQRIERLGDGVYTYLRIEP